MLVRVFSNIVCFKSYVTVLMSSPRHGYELAVVVGNGIHTT